MAALDKLEEEGLLAPGMEAPKLSDLTKWPGFDASMQQIEDRQFISRAIKFIIKHLFAAGEHQEAALCAQSQVEDRVAMELKFGDQAVMPLKKNWFYRDPMETRPWLSYTENSALTHTRGRVFFTYATSLQQHANGGCFA